MSKNFFLFFKPINLKYPIYYRNRSRFPDPQWECAEKNIKEMVDYICNEEISRSFVKYCKVLKEQINMVIESLLFHDLNDEICEKIKMCN